MTPPSADDDTQAMSVRIPKPLYERLRLASFEDRKPMSAIIMRGLERELDLRDKHDPDSREQEQ